MDESVADEKNTLSPFNAPVCAGFIEIGDESQVLSSKVGKFEVDLQFMRCDELSCNDCCRRETVDKMFGSIEEAS